MKKTLLKNYYINTAIISMVVSMLSVSIYANTHEAAKESCLITAAALKKTKPLTNTLFVDVRNSHIFNKKHIPNSINIPLELTATKAFLKNRDVVLIGNGWNEPSLIEQCIELNKKGFKSVKVLSGGIIKGLKGVRFEFIKNKSSLTPLRPLISLTSNEFFNNKVKKSFVPVVISNENKKQISIILPYAKIASNKITEKQLLNKLNRLGKGVNPIVIFSDTNPVVDKAINHYLNKPLRKIYYFEGGFSTYKKAVELNKMTAASNQHKRLSTKKPVSCAN